MSEHPEGKGPTTLIIEVIQWMGRKGVKDLKNHPGLWRGETGEWEIKFNPHDNEIEGVKPFTMELAHKIYVAFGVVTPQGGALIGVNEDDLIEHFQAADRPEEAA